MESKPQMTKEDQKYINEFSRLHQKNKVIDAELKAINEKINNLKDASSAVDELFGENTKIMVGETFIEMPEEVAKERIDKLTADVKKLKLEFEEKQAANKERLNELKVILYSKFGNSINLEE